MYGVGERVNPFNWELGGDGNAGEGHGWRAPWLSGSSLFMLKMEINLDMEKQSFLKVMNMPSHPIPDLSVFVRAVDLGSFAAVGAETGLTASGVSRIVTRLERRLGVALLHRTTRRLVLTQEGETFLAHARSILAAVEAAEADVASVHGRPRGMIRINSGTAFARRRLARWLPQFMEQYPDIRIDLTVSDHRIDPISEQIDVTIRVGPLADSDLIAVRLGEVRRIIVGSPQYLERNGVPEQPSDLMRHNCLQLSGYARLAQWPMFEHGKPMAIPVNGTIRSDSAELLLDLALAGAGLIRLGDFLGEEALREGRLVPLLSHCHDDDPQPITALILPGRQAIPRVRAFVDFLKANC
ncbi:LysR family transcriptional regulator [Bradyrhizobium manausense]|uniref:LysR family transcriptional regulator n=1 Tax=Bradyrhizobium TaxID=374 RepID=UPI001BA97F23|nr:MULTISPECIES: LysR family transcriptional regulator [Bradyrhizobium]MBR0828672.1 LysR family transcriptional regulator [Bradyrhizobium manausense]UVO32618.1 LysR family transcriptional regulator [Bradyrhizobium arachidis]